MKFLNIVLAVFISVLMPACNNNQQQPVTNDAGAETPKIDFSKVIFATKKDTSCGMPLTAGLEDSVQLQGNVYGFCSKECKDEFVAKLKKENKR